MFDLIIVGTGPAGLTAAIYASCYKLNHMAVGQTMGGQLTLATHVLNYPGFTSIAGKDLVQKMIDQAKERGCQFINEEVINIKKIENGFGIRTKTGNDFSGRALILATGTERKKLNVPGELKYTGRGVYYCATCEPFIYKDKDVVIVGAGNSAFQAGSQIVDGSKSLTMLVRSERIPAEPIWVEKIKNNPKAKILLNTKIQEIKGDEVMREIIVEENGQVKSIPSEAIFVEIGGVPGTAMVVPLGIKLTQKGFIEVDHTMQTSVAGIFAAGDIVGDVLSLEQLSTAVGLGARAAASVYYYLKQQKAPIVWGEAEIKRQ